MADGGASVARRWVFGNTKTDVIAAFGGTPVAAM